MASLHVICRDRLHLHVTQFPEFESGYWDLSEGDAQRLVGGMLYLHQKKGEPSYFGGTVQSYRVSGPEDVIADRIVFTITATAEGKGASWRGASHGMAWSSGIIE
ncbi:hypothetical protein ACFODL_08895 [Phenylobacterium terrae]|uniref:Uncharacterized protein n=1 Tax=Phenylobacterium terrae TaxID=2665495 RepID=A0ABW4N568_9CAUL